MNKVVVVLISTGALTVQVSYAEGSCKVPELPELQMISDFSPIKTCLMTKWPTIELSWFNDIIPSLN